MEFILRKVCKRCGKKDEMIIYNVPNEMIEFYPYKLGEFKTEIEKHFKNWTTILECVDICPRCSDEYKRYCNNFIKN